MRLYRTGKVAEMLRCKCSLIADRDVVSSWNIRLKGLKSLKIDVGSTVPPESPPMKKGGREGYPLRKHHIQQK